jgi:hypothetical protein
VIVAKKGFVWLAVVSLISLSLISGCTNSARLRVQYGADTKAFLNNIEPNYDKYVIHALKWPVDEVSAIVFDPKVDNRTIENDGWTKITTQEQLSKLIARSDRLIFRQFFEILGPNDDFYGYLLGGPQYFWIETIDDDTLKLINARWSPPKEDRYYPFQF